MKFFEVTCGELKTLINPEEVQAVQTMETNRTVIYTSARMFYSSEDIETVMLLMSDVYNDDICVTSVRHRISL